jgi:asparagine synthase (glutamine-hydrolysing)
MCGIAGVAGFDDLERPRAITSAMIGELARRGPDDERIATWNKAVLGSRRLAVFDPSDAGRQPMVSADLRIGVVFNGAIYNFRSLRKELSRAGAAFKSDSDTEVLLHGYEHWGIERLIARLDGMFAFALWDNRYEKLFLVRDRLGVKPLVYATHGERIFFASTVDALRHAGIPGSHNLDSAAVLEYLNFGFVTDERTIFKGFRKVPAGSLVEWTTGRREASRYWAPCYSEELPISFPEAVEETERLLVAAVEKRLNADVPVGALLSGGIDSSLICWAAKDLGADIPTFTLGMPGDSSDETREAMQTVASLDLKNTKVPFGPLDWRLNDLLAAHSEPFACASSLGMLQLCSVASHSATVLLTGEGGDEAFLGYPAYQAYRTAERLAHGLPSAARGLVKGACGLMPDCRPTRRASHLLDYATGGLGAVRESHSLLSWFDKHDLWGERLTPGRVAKREYPRSIESARNLISEFQRYHFDTRFTGEYMTKIDASSMFFGLEARSPFLDLELWNFASRIPVPVRLSGGEPKAVLRAIARRRIGRSVSQYVKRGFTVPVGGWLVTQWKPVFEQVLADSILEREGWFRPNSLAPQVKRAEQQGRADLELWHIFVLECWLRHHENRATPVRKAAEPVAEICCISR